MKKLAIVVVSMFCICMLPACSNDTGKTSDPSPKTVEEAASHYYYDSEGHIHRDY